MHCQAERDYRNIEANERLTSLLLLFCLGNLIIPDLEVDFRASLEDRTIDNLSDQVIYSRQHNR